MIEQGKKEYIEVMVLERKDMGKKVFSFVKTYKWAVSCEYF